MNARLFLLLMFVGLAVLAVPSLLYAKRVGVLSVGEFLLPVLPSLLMFASLQGFNKPAQVGWAFVVYPFLCAALSVALLYLRVFALRHITVPQIRISIWVLVVACIAAFWFGAVAEPLYE